MPDEVFLPFEPEGMEGLGAQYIHDQEQSIPLGKLGTPEDCGHAVLFLASDEASYITGSEYMIDGGLSRKPIF